MSPSVSARDVLTLRFCPGILLLVATVIFGTPRLACGVTFPPPPPSVPTHALQFSATGQFVEISKPGEFNVGNALTIEAWVYITAFERRDQAIVTKGESWGISRYENTSRISFRTKNGNSIHNLPSASNLQVGRWYHIAAVYDGSAKQLFIDGQLNASAAFNLPLESNSYPVTFASNAEANNRDHRGQIDAVRIWEIARSLPQIRADLDRDLHGDEAGLLGEWRFDEASETAVLDSSIGERHGTMRNMSQANRVNGFEFRGPPPIAALPHGALRFDRDDRQFLVVENESALFDLTGNTITIEAWVNIALFDKPWQAIVTKGEAWGVTRSGTSDRVAFRTWNGTAISDLTSASDLLPNRWYHLAAVLNGTQKLLYIDGVLESSAAYTVPLQSNSFPLLAGGNAQQLDRAFNGTIDSVRIWSSARTHTELNINLLRELRGNETGLLADWRLNEPGGEVVTDQSYGENHAKLINMTGDNRVPGLVFQPAPPLEATTPHSALRLTGAAPSAFPRVVIGNEPGFDFTDKITIEAWVNIAAFNKPWQAIVTKGEAWGVTRARESNKIAFRTQLPFGPFDLESTSELEMGRWYHIAAVYDGSQKLLYMDGKLEANVPFNGKLLLNDHPLVLGGNAEQLDRGFNGRLETVRVWSEARTGAEIRSQIDRDLRGSEFGLVGDWRFNEASGTLVLDHSSNHLDGLMTEMAIDDRVEGLLFRAPASGNLAIRLEQSGGEKQFITLPEESQFDFPNQISVETWVYFDALPSNTVALVSKGTDGWSLKLRPSGKIQFSTPGLTDPNGNPLDDLLSSTTLEHGQWHHVAVTWHPIRKEKIIYIQGLRDATDNGLQGTLAQNDLPVLFGASPAGSGNQVEHFSGVLDEVRLWQVARPEEQIRESHNRRLNGTEPMLAGSWSLDEGSGLLAADSKFGGGLHGTLESNMSALNRVDGVILGSPAPSQYALTFNGIDQYIEVSDSPHLNLQESATIEAWIKPAGTGFRTILYKGATGYGFALDGNNYLRFFTDALNANALSSNQRVENDTWSHVAVTIDGPSQITTFFINGKPVGTHDSGVIPTDVGSLFIGRQGSLAANNYFAGEMDEVRVWNTARSNLEVEFLAFRQLPLASTGLLAYWTFNDGKGATVMDSAPTRLDGILFGMNSSNWIQGQSWPVPALEGNIQLTPDPSTSGLWIGQILLNKVNEVQSAVNGSSEVLQPTADTASIRVLIHVNARGEAQLLKDVVVMQTRVDPQDTNAVRRSVLVTDPALIMDFDGVVKRGGKMVGLRYGTTAYDFTGTSLPLLGGVGHGAGCIGGIVLAADHPTNPFRHKFHPDHRSGYEITRQFSFEFDGTPGEALGEAPAYGVNQLTGTYRETITGLHKIPLKTEGTISLSRISSVSVLNNQQ